MIRAFNDFNPYGTTFRYGDISCGNYIYVDMLHAKRIMHLVSESFKTIKSVKRNIVNR
jgi:hypothetical protein